MFGAFVAAWWPSSVEGQHWKWIQEEKAGMPSCTSRLFSSLAEGSDTWHPWTTVVLGDGLLSEDVFVAHFSRSVFFLGVKQSESSWEMVHGPTLDLQADGMGMYLEDRNLTKKTPQRPGHRSLLWISRGKSRISRRNTLRRLGSFETGDGLGKPMEHNEAKWSNLTCADFSNGWLNGRILVDVFQISLEECFQCFFFGMKHLPCKNGKKIIFNSSWLSFSEPRIEWFHGDMFPPQGSLGTRNRDDVCLRQHPGTLSGQVTVLRYIMVMIHQDEKHAWRIYEPSSLWYEHDRQ